MAMNFEPEKMKAGYTFVRVIRSLGYAALIAGTAAAIGLAGKDIYEAYNLRTQGDENRARMEQEIVNLTQGTEPAVKRAEQQAAEKVLQQTELYADALPPYKKALIIASSEVRKLTGIPEELQAAMEIPADIPDSLEAAAALQAKIGGATAHSGDFKRLIYSEVAKGYNSLLSPLQEEYQKLRRECEAHKDKIRADELEIWRIKNSEKDPAIFTRTYTEDGHAEPLPNVYGAETEDQTGRFKEIVTQSLPGGRNKIPYIPSENVQRPAMDISLTSSGSDVSEYGLDTTTTMAELPQTSAPASGAASGADAQVREKLLESISLLQDWFPRWVDGETTTVTDRVDGVKLTPEQRVRMSELTMEISDEKAKIQALLPKMEPIAERIEKLEASRQMVIDKTMATATEGWVLDSCLGTLRSSIQSLVSAMLDQQNKTLEKQVREQYERQIADLHASIENSTRADAAESNAYLLAQLPMLGAFFGAAWLGCFLIQVLADFLVCPLVLALRVQFDEELRRR